MYFLKVLMVVCGNVLILCALPVLIKMITIRCTSIMDVQKEYNFFITAHTDAPWVNLEQPVESI